MIEDSLYAATYEAFKANRIREVKNNAETSKSRFPMGANRDKFVFISGLSKLNDGDADGCLADMNEVVKNYPTRYRHASSLPTDCHHISSCSYIIRILSKRTN